MSLTIAAHIASLVQAIENCDRSGNHEWRAKHSARMHAIVRHYLPSGSGIDTGTSIDPSATSDRLVFACSFHHMDAHGSYDGWTDHKVIVRPTFDGVAVDVKGRNRNGIKEYLSDVYLNALMLTVDRETIDRLMESRK